MDGDADAKLAIALARFLADKHPRGLAFGALTNAEVRQAMGEHMKDAGMKCFKPKWLHKFPSLLIYDGKIVRAVSQELPIEIYASAGYPGETKEGVHGDQSSISLVHPVHCSLPEDRRSIRSCLKSLQNSDGTVTRKSCHVRWTRFLDHLSFKKGNPAATLLQTGRGAKRPVVFDPPEGGMIPFNHFKRGEGRLAKIGLDSWCDAKSLPPVEDDVDVSEDIKKTVDEYVDLPGLESESTSGEDEEILEQQT